MLRRRSEQPARPKANPRGRPKPKQLAEQPTAFDLHDQGGGQGGFVLPAQSSSTSRAGGGGVVVTDEEAEGVAGEESVDAVDPRTRALALEIATAIQIRPPRLDPRRRRSAGQMHTVPYRDGADEIDIDATLRALAENPWPEDADVMVRDRVRRRRPVVLLVDASGSMRGERIRVAAATLGALAGELPSEDLAALAFWSDAAWLCRLGEGRGSEQLVSGLLALTAKGLTNVAFPLETAARELATVAGEEPRAVLLSDCVHNAGPDPREAAARLPRLDVLLDVTGENDVELGRELAHAGRGRLQVVHDHRAIAPAISAIFAD
ncbi:MAG TPA: VWA domain-containing protein [Solirubrobacterales bacterium]